LTIDAAKARVFLATSQVVVETSKGPQSVEVKLVNALSEEKAGQSK
jgi:hypothetical protein